MRKFTSLLLLLVAVPLMALAASSKDVPAGPSGTWVTYTQDTNEPEGLVHIYPGKDDSGELVYNGKIGKSLLKQPTGPSVCQNCPAPFTGKKIDGLQFLWGFKPDENDDSKFTDGHVLDPRSGNVYNANMTLSEDGNTLVFRGYMGLSLFGADRTWTRYQGKAKK